MKRTLRIKALGFSAALLAGTMLGGVTLAPAFTQQADAKPIAISPPQGAPLTFADLVDKVSPAVVSVNVISEEEVGDVPEGMEDFFEFFRNRPGFEDYFRDRDDGDGEDDGPQTRESRSLGSGFFISADGLIVTNNHVIRNATEIEVVLDDGREIECELVGADERTDLAVLKVKEPGNYPYVEFETDVEPRRGDWVLALGNPFGFGGTATAGIISADGRQLRGAGPYTDYLQIDAAINKGNSGGPTFDLQGNVVGVNTAIISPTGGSVGLGFAIKAEQAKPIVDQLIQNGKVERGWLGVSIQSFNEDMAAALGLDGETGALVRQVVVDSPAQKAGIRVNDIILKIDGREMEDSTEVTRTVGAMLAASEHEFTIWREGELKTLKVKIGVLPDDVSELPYQDENGPSGESSSDNSTTKMLGMSLSTLSNTDRKRLGLDNGKPGIVINSVKSGTPAGRLGLAPGQAIVEANFKPVSSPEDLQKIIDDARAQGRESILISVRINQVTNVVPLEIEDKD